MSPAVRFCATEADVRALAKLTCCRHGGRMLTGHALCWLGRGSIGTAVRAAVHGRGTMLEERHRIDRSGPPGPVDAEWDVAADIADCPPARIVVRTHALSGAGESLLAEVHLLAVGDRVPARRPADMKQGTLLREVAFYDADIEAYVALSGDDNVLHVDPDAAARAGLPGRAVHGALVAAALEAAVCDEMGGAHAVSVSARFVGALVAGEVLSIAARDLGAHDGRRIVRAFGSCAADLVCAADFAFNDG